MPGQTASGFGRGFTGYVADNETGLMYARERMYSPSLGCFISRDPLVYVDGYSTYRGYFVPNSLDPSGQGGPAVVVGIVLGVAGVILGWESLGCDPNSPIGEAVQAERDCKVNFQCVCTKSECSICDKNGTRVYTKDCPGKEYKMQKVKCERSAWFGWLRGRWIPFGAAWWTQCDAANCCP